MASLLASITELKSKKFSIQVSLWKHYSSYEVSTSEVLAELEGVLEVFGVRCDVDENEKSSPTGSILAKAGDGSLGASGDRGKGSFSLVDGSMTSL